VSQDVDLGQRILAHFDMNLAFGGEGSVSDATFTVKDAPLHNEFAPISSLAMGGNYASSAESVGNKYCDSSVIF